MKRYINVLLSVTTGLLLTFSWPENGFTPLLFVAFVPLFFIQQRLGDSGRKGMFWYAWLAFLLWNVLTTWWVWNSTEWGSVAAFVLNALFMAITFWLFHLSKKKLFNNQKGLYILLFYWVTFEFLHMNWDLTWSWLNLGNAFATHPDWIQWYNFTGTLGGTLWVLAVNMLVFQLLHGWTTKQPYLHPVLTSVLLTMVLVVPIVVSEIVYHQYEEQGTPVEVVVVQPNTDPYTEQYTLSPDSLLSRLLVLAKPQLTSTTDYLIFPESALQEDIMEDKLQYAHALNRLREFLDNYPNLAIITGATTYRNLLPGEVRTNAARKYANAERYYYAYNTAFLIQDDKDFQWHHKSKLTPGAEIMPSWGILKPLEALAIDLGGTVGTLKKEDHPMVFTQHDSALNVSPIICYESVYGEFVAQSVRLGAGIVVVITNDGWWGQSPGYRQHLLFSVLRAIETRRDVARSANTGVSAFINQRGDIVQRTAYWEPAAIQQELKSNSVLTYYVKNGDYLGRVSAYISGLFLLVSFTQGFLRYRKKY